MKLNVQLWQDMLALIKRRTPALSNVPNRFLKVTCLTPVNVRQEIFVVHPDDYARCADGMMNEFEVEIIGTE